MQPSGHFIPKVTELAAEEAQGAKGRRRLGAKQGKSGDSSGTAPASPRVPAAGSASRGRVSQEHLFLDLTLTAPSKLSPKSFLKGHNRDNLTAAVQSCDYASQRELREAFN